MRASGIALRCADPEIRDRLARWLDELQLDLPPGLVLEVGTGSVPALPDCPPIFEQPEVAFFRGPGGRGVRLFWDVAPASGEVSRGASVAMVRLSPAAVRRFDRCTRTFLMAVLIVLARQAGWFHLHAATAIDPRGRGWLIAGDAHAGKSTTAALLAASQWQVGTDDAAFLEEQGGQGGQGGPGGRVIVHTCRARIALRDGGRRLLARSGGVNLRARRKVGFWPEDLGGTWTPLVDPEIIIFTSVGRVRTAARPLDRLAAAMELVRWSAWVVLEPDLAQRHLDLLTHLTQQARCYRMTLGRDLFDRPNRLIELVT